MKPTIYKPRGVFTPAVDLKRCRRAVGTRSAFSQQCGRTGRYEWADPDTDETFRFCKRHHPDSVAKRQAKAQAEQAERHEAERKRAVAFGLRHATEAELAAEVSRRGIQVSFNRDQLDRMIEP